MNGADVELIRIRSMGRPAQMQTAPGDAPFEAGVLGVAVSAKAIADRSGQDQEHTVVQVMLDDDRPGFDRSLLDRPMMAEVRTPAGDLVTRDLFDHDAFRQQLHDDRAAGGDELRGVLLLTSGQLPPGYLRLAFLPVPVADTDGCDLVVVSADRDELLDAVDRGYAEGTVSEGERDALRITIEQRHPS